MKRKEDLRRKRLKELRQKRMIIGFVVTIGILLLASAFVIPAIYRNLSASQNNVDPNIILPTPRDYPQVSGNAMGDPNAPVKVSIFSNFYCGHCKTFAQVAEANIVDTYIKTGKVFFTEYAYTWSDQAFLAAQASYCAREQGKFWEYRDMVFANVSNPKLGALDTLNLTKLAVPLQLDMDKFSQCLQTQKYANEVLNDIDLAKSLGLQGTPTFIVNGKVVYANELIDTIESELQPQDQP